MIFILQQLNRRNKCLMPATQWRLTTFWSRCVISVKFCIQGTYFTYAKPHSYGCPQESTPTNRNDSFCCRYNNDTTDCGWRYYGESYKGVHYTNCVGRLKCTIQVAWNRTELNCDPHIYMSKSNYMRQFYHCIKSKNDTLLSSHIL